MRDTYPTPAQRIPGYLPYPQPVSPGDILVPNEAFGFWPQGQFAPEYFPPGSASFQQYAFPDNQLVLYGDALGNPDGLDVKKVVLLALGVVGAYYLGKRLGWL